MEWIIMSVISLMLIYNQSHILVDCLTKVKMPNGSGTIQLKGPSDSGQVVN